MFYVLFTYSKGRKERDFRGFRSEGELIDFLHLEYERIDIVQIISVEKSYRLGLVETEYSAKSALIQTVEEAAESLKETLETDLPDPEEKGIRIGVKAGINISKKDVEEAQAMLLEKDEAGTGEKMEEAEPGEPLTGEKDDRSSKKHPYLKDRKEEKSAMEKIGDDVEGELTDEEIMKKNKEALKRGDEAIAAAEKEMEKKPKNLIINPKEKPEKRHYTQNEDRKKNWKLCPECKKEKMAPWNTSDRCSKCQQYKKIPKKKTRKLPF